VSCQTEICASDGLFTCQRHVGDLRLTPSTCAGMWARARRNREEDRIRLAPCMGCDVGAANAGEPVSAKAAPGKATPASVGQTCCRCGQGGLRLVLGRTLCASCYNRQREYQAGRNAKGGETRGHRPLFCAVVGEVGMSGCVTPRRVEWVSSHLEAKLIVARQAGARQSRMLMLSPAIHGQIGLFGGFTASRAPAIESARGGGRPRRMRVAVGQLWLPGVWS
jgi:hypothetical protein